jgi:hypothetical protein
MKKKTAKTTPKKTKKVTAASNAAQTSSNVIPILSIGSAGHPNFADEPDADEERGAIGDAVGHVVGLAEDKLVDMVIKLEHAFEAVGKAIRSYQIDEIEVALEVAANGQIGLKCLGSVETEGKGSIKLKLKRKA